MAQQRVPIVCGGRTDEDVRPPAGRSLDPNVAGQVQHLGTVLAETRNRITRRERPRREVARFDRRDDELVCRPPPSGLAGAVPGVLLRSADVQDAVPHDPQSDVRGHGVEAPTDEGGLVDVHEPQHVRPGSVASRGGCSRRDCRRARAWCRMSGRTGRSVWPVTSDVSPRRAPGSCRVSPSRGAATPRRLAELRQPGSRATGTCVAPGGQDARSRDRAAQSASGKVGSGSRSGESCTRGFPPTRRPTLARAPQPGQAGKPPRTPLLRTGSSRSRFRCVPGARATGGRQAS
jgi:hypothetical protein